MEVRFSITSIAYLHKQKQPPLKLLLYSVLHLPYRGDAERHLLHAGAFEGDGGDGAGE